MLRTQFENPQHHTVPVLTSTLNFSEIIFFRGNAQDLLSNHWTTGARRGWRAKVIRVRSHICPDVGQGEDRTWHMTVGSAGVLWWLPLVCALTHPEMS